MFLASRSRHSLRLLNRFSPLYAVLNAALQAIGDTILQPVIVLSAIAFLFGGSNYQVAAFAVIAVAAWALAPIVLMAVTSISSRPYPVVFSAGLIRLASMLVIGIVGFRIDDISGTRILSILVGSYFVYQVASSVAVQSSAGLIVSGVPRSRQGVTFRHRAFAAIAASVVCGLAGWTVFRSDQPFVDVVGMILMLAALSVFSATWFLLSIPGGSSRAYMPQPKRTLASIANAFRTAPFRRFISFKVLLAIAAATDPFLIVYGFQEFDLTVHYIGWALAAYAGGQAIGYVIWPQWVERHSPRVPFQVAALLRLLLLAWIISLPALTTSTVFTDLFESANAAKRTFALGFILLGLASSVGNAANQRYLLDIAPRDRTPGSILAANIVAALTAFAPFGVAWLLGRYELERVLWGAIGVAIVALLASGLLVESRVRIRTSAGSWRSRRQSPRTV